MELDDQRIPDDRRRVARVLLHEPQWLHQKRLDLNRLSLLTNVNESTGATPFSGVGQRSDQSVAEAPRAGVWTIELRQVASASTSA